MFILGFHVKKFYIGKISFFSDLGVVTEVRWYIRALE